MRVRTPSPSSGVPGSPCSDQVPLPPWPHYFTHETLPGYSVLAAFHHGPTATSHMPLPQPRGAPQPYLPSLGAEALTQGAQKGNGFRARPRMRTVAVLGDCWEPPALGTPEGNHHTPLG